VAVEQPVFSSSESSHEELGQAVIDWLISPQGQKAIADDKIDGCSKPRPH
jgi:ABC-type Fe3+ transport system substrate-binding protein